MIAAVVAAAGRSERMGRPKLVLPLGGRTIIARVVAGLRDGGADPVIVVGPPCDEPGAGMLVAEARSAGALVVQPATPTADMRASIERGLEPLRAGPAPEAVLIAPGDCPGIDPAVVARLIAAARGPHPGAMITPVYEGRRGHPVLIPWHLAAAIPDLPRGRGVNALLAQHPDRLVELECGDPRVLDDLDTPDDYRRWTHAFGPEGGGSAD